MFEEDNFGTTFTKKYYSMEHLVFSDNARRMAVCPYVPFAEGNEICQTKFTSA